ncbi:MAG: ABC transporter permease [Planctomycetales bacterium]|nr:ABC transporter permease [Planctomycetales bacterium]
MSLRRFSQRAMLSRPGRTILTIASIVIGVAAVVSVTIVTATTRESYQVMFAAVRGKTSLEVVAQNTGPIPGDLVGKVASLEGVEGAVPLVQRPSSLTKGEQRVRLQILGIDPDADKLIRDMEVVEGRLLTADDVDKILLETEFAKYLEFKVGDEVKLLANKGGPRKMQVVGLIKMSDGGALTQTGLVFLPVKQAALRFVGKGNISTVQIVAKPDADLKALQATIQKLLPDGIEVREPKGGAQVLQETLLSTEQGLTLTTAFTLLLSGFIILNTFLMNVGERRRQLAIMRAVGATRDQIAGMLIGESLILATIGTVIGILLGLGIAYVLVSALSQLLDISLPSPIKYMLAPRPYLLAALFGFSISVVGAVFPAIRAWKVSPLEGLSHVSKQDMSSVPFIHIVIGFVIAVTGAALIAAGIAGQISIEVPQYGAVALLIGVVLMYPLVLAPLSNLASHVVRFGRRVETSLALKQILRHRGRTSLTVGVLFIAGATGVAMAHSILDNVRNLKDWYRRALIGDYYIRAMLPDMATGLSADLPEELEAPLTELERAGDIAYLDRVKMVEAQAKVTDRKGAIDATKEIPEELNIILAIRQFHEPGKIPFDLIAGNADKIRDEMIAGEVVIGNIAAAKLQVSEGDTLEIGGGEGRHKVRICGVTNDYLVGGLTLYMNWETGEKLMKTQGVDGYIIRADRAKMLDLKPKLEAICKKNGVLLNSQAQIGKRIDQISIGISGCLWGLIFLSFVVAAFGVVNTLSMNVLEQTRELGLLRIVAMTRRQVRRTITTQALIIGMVGLIPGVSFGLGIAWVINLAMEPSFGRPIEFTLHPLLMLFALFGSMLITFIAAAIPAQRAAGVDLAQALHYE